MRLDANDTRPARRAITALQSLASANRTATFPRSHPTFSKRRGTVLRAGPDAHCSRAHARVLTTELPKPQADLRDRNRYPPVWRSNALKRKIDLDGTTIVLPTFPIDVPNLGRHVPNFELDSLNSGLRYKQLATDSRANESLFSFNMCS